MLPRYRHRKQFHFGGAKRNIHCNAAICAARMNINKVSRVKYWGDSSPPVPTLRIAEVVSQSLRITNQKLYMGKLIDSCTVVACTV